MDDSNEVDDEGGEMTVNIQQFVEPKQVQAFSFGHNLPMNDHLQTLKHSHCSHRADFVSTGRRSVAATIHC